MLFWNQQSTIYTPKGSDVAVETERKFLVMPDWKSKLTFERIVAEYKLTQGYLCRDVARTVRIRTNSSTNVAYVTIKGPRIGISCAEFEYTIPYEDGIQLLAMCPEKLEKTRYVVSIGTYMWEVDEFAGLNDGLILAEIELEDPEEIVPIPFWIDCEVSDDHRYTNAHLVSNRVL